MAFEAPGQDKPTLTGVAPAHGSATVGRARRASRVLNLVGLGLFVWGLLAPRPYLGLILASMTLPLLAASAVGLSRGRIRWSSSWTPTGPNVELALWGAVGILGLRTFLDIDVIDWARLLPAALAAGAAGALAAAGAGPWRGDGVGETAPDWLHRLGETMLVWLFVSLYAYGAIGQANSQLDRGPASVISRSVVAKAARGHVFRLHELILAPTNALPGGPLSVDGALYDAVATGGRVCVQEHPGALGIRWRTVGRCRGMG